jgi:hypothetical protein
VIVYIYIARYECLDSDGEEFVREEFFSTPEKARDRVKEWNSSDNEVFYRGTVDFYVWKRELDTQKQEHVYHAHVERTYEEYMQMLAKKTGGRVAGG